MGILNVTPDSFSDGGKFSSISAALTQAKKMLSEGASIIDVGGESTRPGASTVSSEEECQRVLPVIEALREESDCVISIDSSKPEVMHEAVKAGANFINDVRALQAPGALDMASKLQVPVCLMHMQGDPHNMQNAPIYNNVVDDVKKFLIERIQAANDAGIPTDKIIIDPGFGFGKSQSHNICLFKSLNRFIEMNVPVMVGVSRKSIVGAILDNAPAHQRVNGSVALAALAGYMGALIIRVHDVKPTVDALKVAMAVSEVMTEKEAS